MTDYFFVLVGGAFGAVCRFAISSLIKRSISSEFPIATLLINMIGSFLIGLLVAAHSGNLIQLLLGIGFMVALLPSPPFSLRIYLCFEIRIIYLYQFT